MGFTDFGKGGYQMVWLALPPVEHGFQAAGVGGNRPRRTSIGWKKKK